MVLERAEVVKVLVCLSCITAMVKAEADAMPCDVNAEHARDRSPSEARRRALVALSACWWSCVD